MPIDYLELTGAIVCLILSATLFLPLNVYLTICIACAILLCAWIIVRGRRTNT